MTGRTDTAEQVRHRRLAFERAMRDGTSVAVAAQAVARDRWEAADRRLAERRCGTDARIEQTPRPRQWWQEL